MGCVKQSDKTPIFFNSQPHSMLLGISLLFTFAVIFVSTKWRMLSYFFGKKDGPKAANLPNGDVARDHLIVSEADTLKSVEEQNQNSDEDDGFGDATPKALAQSNGLLPVVPTLNLELPPDSDDEAEDEDLKNLPPPSFPALNSIQRASGPSYTRGPPKLNPISNSSASLDAKLMPPPLRPSIRPPTQPNTAAALRAPPTGPLPNRLPPTSPSTLQLPSHRLTNPARQKVVLAPGYSPLDWATLQRTTPNLSGVSSPQLVTAVQLRAHNGRKGAPAWAAFRGRVYNISPYIPFHPGGEAQIRRAAGKDAEKLFNEVHAWVNWEGMLGACCVGILVPESYAEDNKGLEGLD